MTKRILMAICVVVLAEGAAFGQALQWKEGRVFASANGGYHSSGDREEPTSFSFTLYDETAQVDVKRSVSAGPIFDFSLGSRVFGNFGVAGTVVLRGAASDGAITGTIPHPVFFDRPRSVTATLAGMGHKETWIALQGVYLLQFDAKTSLMFMGGPAVVAVKHEIPGTVSAVEGASSPTVTVTRNEISKSLLGFMIGGDFRYMLTKNVGLGAFARYAGATGNLTAAQKLDVSGIQVGAGVRIAFK